MMKELTPQEGITIFNMYEHSTVKICDARIDRNTSLKNTRIHNTIGHFNTSVLQMGICSQQKIGKVVMNSVLVAPLIN